MDGPEGRVTVAEREDLLARLALEAKALESLGLEERLDGGVGRRNLAVELVAAAVLRGSDAINVRDAHLEDIARGEDGGDDDSTDGEAEADSVAALVCTRSVAPDRRKDVQSGPSEAG